MSIRDRPPRIVHPAQRGHKLRVDTNRRLGAVAREIGLPPPSYEQTRLLVHQLRCRTRVSTHAGELLLDIALQKRPPEAVVELFMP